MGVAEMIQSPPSVLPDRKHHERTSFHSLDTFLLCQQGQLGVFRAGIEDDAPRMQGKNVVVQRRLAIRAKVKRHSIYIRQTWGALLDIQVADFAASDAYWHSLMAMLLQTQGSEVSVTLWVGRGTEDDGFFHNAKVWIKCQKKQARRISVWLQ